MLDKLIGEPIFAGVQLVTKEVALDDELTERFAQTLPVMCVNEQELHSPFTIDEAKDWLTAITS